MKLLEIIENINRINENLIIFQENFNDFNSDVILSKADEGEYGVKFEGGKKYHYLIEVFLAKEFIEDWICSLDYIPNNTQKAKRLFEYAIKDA